MHCVNDWAARSFANADGMAAAKQQAINNRIAELMAGTFSPELNENIEEALDNLNDDQREIRTALVKFQSVNAAAIMKQWVAQYWALMAEQQAEEEYEKKTSEAID